MLLTACRSILHPRRPLSRLVLSIRAKSNSVADDNAKPGCLRDRHEKQDRNVQRIAEIVAQIQAQHHAERAYLLHSWQQKQDLGPSELGYEIDKGAQAFGENKSVGPDSKVAPAKGKGFAAEHYHCTTFNASAVQNQSELRCEMPRSNKVDSPDLVLKRDDGDVVCEAQVKYGQPQYIRKSCTEGRYEDQQIILPTDHPNDGQYSVEDGQTTLEVEDVQSAPLSNKDAEDLAGGTEGEFKNKIVEDLELENDDLRCVRKPVSVSVEVSSHRTEVAGTNSCLDGSSVYVNHTATVTYASDDTCIVSSGFNAGLSQEISDTGTTLDGGVANLHGSCSTGRGLSGGSADIVGGISVGAGYSKGVLAHTSSDGRTSGSVSVSGNVGAGLSATLSQGFSAPIYAGVHLHGQVSHQVNDNVNVGLHGSAGVSNIGIGGSVGGHVTTTSGNCELRNTTTNSGALSVVNGIPTSVSGVSSSTESGPLRSATSTTTYSASLSSGFKIVETGHATTTSGNCFVHKTTSSSSTSTWVNGITSKSGVSTSMESGLLCSETSRTTYSKCQSGLKIVKTSASEGL
eukprot:3015661-Amphidinium_carterae.1